jgi:hypothetical protein
MPDDRKEEHCRAQVILRDPEFGSLFFLIFGRSSFGMSLFSIGPFFALLFGLAALAIGTEWPSNFVVHSGTESPRGRYAILVPPYEPESDQNTDCYLADLQSHQVLGKLDGLDYFEHQNHADLSAIWSADSARCVVTREGRFGFDTIVLVELRGHDFRQVDLGTAIQRSLDAVIAKGAAKDGVDRLGSDATAYIRFAKDNRIRFRAVSTSNPKELDGVRSHYALFQGTYDPGAARWTVTDARSLNGEMFGILSDAYIDADDDTNRFATEESKAEAYDRELNEVYSALRFILPKAQFESVKAAQLAWLKQRDAAPSIEEKNRRILARIKALQDLLW